ncbi:MAG: ACT domain-containing protein [Planctomycetota bacterium]|jgi:ACT domain-containing protein|nr:ACT domain-containing protein [Planctomycetota bacterium]
MGRRFLTAEDVRRAPGAELLIEADTVVTPQALEIARAAGIQLRTEAGEWSSSAPERGPDAADAHELPEPEGSTGPGTTVVVTVVGRNRPGVLAEVTGALGAAGANIDNISQKMVDSFFHLVLTTTLGPEPFAELKTRLECLGGEGDYVVRVMHERVFSFMHRV